MLRLSQLKGYCSSLQANDSDCCEMDATMLINELLKHYFTALSCSGPLAVNKKQVQTVQSQVWTLSNVESLVRYNGLLVDNHLSNIWLSFLWKHNLAYNYCSYRNIFNSDHTQYFGIHFNFYLFIKCNLLNTISSFWCFLFCFVFSQNQVFPLAMLSIRDFSVWILW